MICNKNGSINLEQLKKELYDYSFILEEVPKVYDYVTDGILSKPNYKAESIIEIFDRNFVDKKIAKDDILSILEEHQKLNKELKQEIKNYFED